MYFVFESNNKLQCKFISSRGGRHLHIDADGTGGLDVSPIQFCRRAKDTEGAGPTRSNKGQGYREANEKRRLGPCRARIQIWRVRGPRRAKKQE